MSQNDHQPAASRDPASHSGRWHRAAQMPLTGSVSCSLPRAHLPGSCCGGAETPSRASLLHSIKGAQWGPEDQDSPALPRWGACSSSSSASAGGSRLPSPFPPSPFPFLSCSPSRLLCPTSLPCSTMLIATDPTDTPAASSTVCEPGCSAVPSAMLKSFNTKQNQLSSAEPPLLQK